jgi:hypothetical protein
MIKHAFPETVYHHATVFRVVGVLSVVLWHILHNVFAQLEHKVMHMFHVYQLFVNIMKTVLTMKLAIDSIEFANPFVRQTLVEVVQYALLETTNQPVLVLLVHKVIHSFSVLVGSNLYLISFTFLLRYVPNIFIYLAVRTPLGECTQDSDCASKLACIDKKCQSPCTLPAVCSPDQECRVQDTLPLRTVMCICPADTVTSPDGHCMPIGN